MKQVALFLGCSFMWCTSLTGTCDRVSVLFRHPLGASMSWQPKRKVTGLIIEDADEV